MLRDVPADTRATESGTTYRTEGTAEQVSGRTPGRASGRAYWLLAKNENGRLEVLVTDLAGEDEAMPVFSHEEEAQMFLGLWEKGCDGWRARQSTAGELISVLYGPCARVKRVALDPLPEMVLEKTVGLVSLSRKRFVDLVLSREHPLASHYHEPPKALRVGSRHKAG